MLQSNEDHPAVSEIPIYITSTGFIITDFLRTMQQCYNYDYCLNKTAINVIN